MSDKMMGIIIIICVVTLLSVVILSVFVFAHFLGKVW